VTPEQLANLAHLGRARDLMDREYARPLDVAALARAALMSTAHDPDLALAFYRDALGLELRNDVAREGFRWITVGAASQPGVAIVLTNYLHGSPADGDAIAALVAKGAQLTRPLDYPVEAICMACDQPIRCQRWLFSELLFRREGSYNVLDGLGQQQVPGRRGVDVAGPVGKLY
jgi:catechol 2,3-dioxygenase-like lactoylglutathione lyase family enzyme